jgi:hypothetical protein
MIVIKIIRLISCKLRLEGLNQLSDYLNRQALKVGYLLIFDHANTKTWTSEWIEWQDKKIFVVWV